MPSDAALERYHQISKEGARACQNARMEAHQKYDALINGRGIPTSERAKNFRKLDIALSAADKQYELIMRQAWNDLILYVPIEKRKE